MVFSVCDNLSIFFTIVKKKIMELFSNMKRGWNIKLQNLSNPIPNMRQNKRIVFYIVSSVLWVLFLIYAVVHDSNIQYEQTELMVEDINGFEVPVVEQFSGSILFDELEAKDAKSVVVMESVEVNTETKSVENVEPIPILVLACNRVTVARCLDRLIKFRRSKERFPIIVSQDCADQATSDAIQSFNNDLLNFIHQPNLTDPAVPTGTEAYLVGYYKLSRHYKWALNKMFNEYNFETVIVVEDDLDVASDFYDYFASTLPILETDTSLWCVSAWNDNGKVDRVDLNAPDLLYRTDFFPGLGWMLRKTLWLELEKQWPDAFWDDWMRSPAIRKNRCCIRPELSRTRTFGKTGVSGGMYYDEYLRYIFLNEQPVEFSKKNLSYLTREAYDPSFLTMVYESPIVSVRELQFDRLSVDGPVRVLYDSRSSVKKIAKTFGLMDDIRNGVPRMAYLGVISFFYNGRRVFITPSYDWNGYFTTALLEF